MAKILDTEGLNRLGADVREMIAGASSSVPTITIALNQVVGQNPLQIQLTQAQYEAFDTNFSVLVDATALGVGWIVGTTKLSYDSGTLNYATTVYNWNTDSVVSDSDAYLFNINRSTKILTRYDGQFYADLYKSADNWFPSGSDNLHPVSPTFVKDIVAATYGYATGITSTTTLPDTVIRDYITCRLPIEINGALCHYMDENTTTNIVHYFTATMNGALVHLNIIEIDTSNWVVTFNQVDVGASPNVDQDLTTNTCFTLDATAFASLVSTHTATVASPVFTGLSNAYEFVTIKASINSVNYNIKLTRNATGKYSGLFFIEDSSHLYEVTVYYNGTSVYLRCATVY